jgi:tetratricopeptide (TPR) repeat protein
LLAKPEEAREHLEAALELDPENLDIIIETGHTMNDLEMFDDALTCFEKALTLLSPEDNKSKECVIDALHGKAYALSNLGRHPAAIEALESLLSLDPANAKANDFFRVLVNIIGTETIGEVVNISINCLKKAIFHALILASQGDFSMAYGILGGKIEHDEVYAYKSFAMGHGTSEKVAFDDGERYVALAKFDDELSTENMFAIGWYASISPRGNFLCSPNAKNHANYQKLNPNAIALAIRPKIMWNADLDESITVYRLADPMFSEKGEKPSWQRLQFALLNTDQDAFMDNLRRNYIEFFKQLDRETIDDEFFNSKLDEWMNKAS